MNVGFLGAPAVAPGPDGVTDAVEEAGPRRLGRARLPRDPAEFRGGPMPGDKPS